MSRILLFGLLTLSGTATVTANQSKIVRLAKCFANDDDSMADGSRFLAGHMMGNGTGAADTLACIGNVSTCFDETTVDTVKMCIQDGVAAANNTSTRFLAGHVALGRGDGSGFGKGGFRPPKQGGSGKADVLADIVKDCLEPHKDCMKQEVRAFIAKLPACVNTTTVALGQCFKANAQTCASTCSTADIPESNPFAGVSPTVVQACREFQDQIMDPSCEIVDCCPQCVSEFSDLMTCVGQELLELKPQTCELTCPAARRNLGGAAAAGRGLMRRKLAGHLATEADAAMVADECAVYLDTEEGTLTADAVTEKMLEGEFIGCVADVAILVAEEQKEFAATQNSGGTDNGTTPSSSHVVGVGVLATALLGLVGFLM